MMANKALLPKTPTEILPSSDSFHASNFREILCPQTHEAGEKHDGIHEFPGQKFWGVGLF
jgi:hypothetical protein